MIKDKRSKHNERRSPCSTLRIESTVIPIQVTFRPAPSECLRDIPHDSKVAHHQNQVHKVKTYLLPPGSIPGNIRYRGLGISA